MVADREGEATCFSRGTLGSKREKYKYSKLEDLIRLLRVILESFADPKEIDTNLVEAQQARRFLDRVVGFELSPLLWKKIARVISWQSSICRIKTSR